MTPERLWDELARAAADAGACRSLHLVGGPVRDRLLGQPMEGIVDVDTVVEGDAAEVAALLHRRLGGELAVHDRFGTATWSPVDLPVTVDVVTARKERYARPGALPEVEPASLEEDLRRRDFTVNAIALRLWPEPRWALFDPLGGERDLAAGLLRIHHDRSFLDDPTRILRLARLAVRLELWEEPATREALDRALRSGTDVFATVSGDRLWAEWELVCREPDPPAVVRWLDARGIAGALGLNPAGRAGHAVLQRAWDGACRGTGQCDPELSMACLLSRGSVERVGRTFGLSGGALARLSSLSDVGRLAPAVLRAADPAELEEILAGTGPRQRRLLEVVQPETAEAIRWYENEVASRPALLDGGDLLDAGMAQGPAVGIALRRLRRAQLRGEVSDRTGALALLGLAPEDR